LFACPQTLQTPNEGLCVGIIGGSGLDDPDLLADRTEMVVETPYGSPSDSLIAGQIDGVQVRILGRHGRTHKLYPSAVNFRANIYALKAAGCTHIIVTTACGSLREEIKPGHLVLLDQYIDRTTKRLSTFYDGSDWDALPGVMHIPQAEPFSEFLRDALAAASSELGLAERTVVKATMVSIEGPRFSSKAESQMFRSWGADLVNMTTVPEVCLAAEAGMPYAALALSTDYDCWKDDEEPVTVEKVLATMASNSGAATDILKRVIPRLAATVLEASRETAIWQARANSSIMLFESKL